MSVPCQKSFAPTMGSMCVAYSVAKVVDARTVMPSRTIHKQGCPRDLPAGFDEGCWVSSVDEDLSVDNPCQNSPMVNTPWLATAIKRSGVFR